MNKKQIFIIILIVVSIISLIAFKTFENFNNKKEQKKQEQEILNIVDDINNKIEDIDLDNATKEELEKIINEYNKIDNQYKSNISSTYQEIVDKVNQIEQEQLIGINDEQEEQLQRMKEEISKLPPLENLTDEYALAINLLIQQYNELTSENKKEIDYNLLEQYKQKLEEIIKQ